MKQVLYRKCTVGEMEGEIFACFPICRGGEIAVFNECGHGWLSLGYFTDCMEDATTEESAAVRKIIKEEEPIHPEEISFSDFMRIMFPEDNKRTFYRLPCDQYGQPCGNIETHSLTVGEYACKKRADREALTALWFDDYAVASWRADN